MKKVLKYGAIVFSLLIVFSVIINSVKSPEQKAAEVAQRAENKKQEMIKDSENLSTITPHDLAVAYHENTVFADQQFKNKRFKISGFVVDINTDVMGNPYITMRGGINEFLEPQFKLDESDSAKIATLKKGSKITLICVGNGDVAKTPMSDCSMI